MESRLQIQEHSHVARANRAGREVRRRRSLRPARAPAAPLTIERRRFGAVVSVTLTGELDLAAAARTDLELREAGAHAELVVLDLRGLTFIDCAGLRALLAAGSLVRAIGGRMVIVHIPPQVRRLLGLPGPSKRLRVGRDPAARDIGRGVRSLRAGRLEMGDSDAR
jgi:anti-sigma B factor antagonist